jgi:hypothetical protein
MKFALLISALVVIVSSQAAKPAAKAAAPAAPVKAKKAKKAKAAKVAAPAKVAKKAKKAKKAKVAKAAPPAAPAAPTGTAPNAPAAAPEAPAAKPKAKKFKFGDHLTRKNSRKDIKAAHVAWNKDNSKYRQKPPALPKTFGLEMHPYATKTTHQRIIEREGSLKLNRVPQFPHHITATSKRVTFRRSDLDRRASNVQEICSGYSNIKQRDACQKRYGVHTEHTISRSKQRLEQARQRCDTIKQSNRRRMCHNSYLRNGTVPYFAQQNEDNNEEAEDKEEAIDAGDEDEDAGDDENDSKGLMQASKANEEGNDDGGADEGDEDESE